MGNKISSFQNLKQSETLCRQALNWSVSTKPDARDLDQTGADPTDAEQAKKKRQERAQHDRELNGAAQDLFGLQENALMDKGGDYTVRLRQLHDQVMVLRGAAFNGVIAFSLCLFGLGAKFRRDHPGSALGWAFAPLPLLYSMVGLIAAGHHFLDRVPSDPPYMEFTLLLLAAAGAWLLWRKPERGIRSCENISPRGASSREEKIDFEIGLAGRALAAAGRGFCDSDAWRRF